MSNNHTVSHLITFILLGGISTAVVILLRGSGGGLYA
jgi:hypothetical protein